MSTGAIAARGLAIALPALAAATGWAFPEEVLWGGVAWLGFVLVVLAGWGSLVERGVGSTVDLGLRLAWGTAALLAVAGVLLAARILVYPALVGLLVVGFAAHVWCEVRADEPTLVRWARAARGWARDPQVAIAWGVLIALAVVNVLGAIARTRGNPYDDDVAYLPMIKRLLDVGELDEPFSFRRLSALGGQTILGALAAVRGTLANQYLIDHGVFQLVTLAQLVGLARRRDRLEPVVLALVVLIVLLLPDASTNTAAYWTGTALFLGLYRTAVELPGLGARGPIVLGGIAAATITLRQNFLPVAALFPLLVLALRLERPWRDGWRRERRAWLATALGGVVVLTPFLIASWQSSQTILYPLMPGTANTSVATTPAAWSVWQELQFFLRVALDPNPIRVMVPLLPVLLMVRDRRPGAPLLAFAIASALGFALLVHAFTLSDARNLWRYAFGFTTVLALVLVVETTAGGWREADDDRAPVSAGWPARLLVLVCLVGQVAYTGKTTLSNLKSLAANLGEAQRNPRGVAAEVGAPALYQRLQAAVPAGAAMVAMLDDAALLDYRRNRIANLDTPGFASAPPGLPMFVGAEAKAAYFRARGLRYLAFVRSSHSRYFYRREYWMERIFWDAELWRIVAAYQLDMGDSFAELATRYPVRFDEGGLVVLDLAGPR